MILSSHTGMNPQHIHIIMINIPLLDLFHHSQVLPNQLFSHLLVAHISPKDLRDHIVFPFSNVCSYFFPESFAQFTLVNHFLLIVSTHSFPIYLCFIGYIVCFLSICHVSCLLFFPPQFPLVSHLSFVLLICAVFIDAQA